MFGIHVIAALALALLPRPVSGEPTAAPNGWGSCPDRASGSPATFVCHRAIPADSTTGGSPADWVTPMCCTAADTGYVRGAHPRYMTEILRTTTFVDSDGNGIIDEGQPHAGLRIPGEWYAPGWTSGRRTYRAESERGTVPASPVVRPTGDAITSVTGAWGATSACTAPKVACHSDREPLAELCCNPDVMANGTPPLSGSHYSTGPHPLREWAPACTGSRMRCFNSAASPPTPECCHPSSSSSRPRIGSGGTGYQVGVPATVLTASGLAYADLDADGLDDSTGVRLPTRPTSLRDSFRNPPAETRTRLAAAYAPQPAAPVVAPVVAPAVADTPPPRTRTNIATLPPVECRYTMPAEACATPNQVCHNLVNTLECCCNAEHLNSGEFVRGRPGETAAAVVAGDAAHRGAETAASGISNCSEGGVPACDGTANTAICRKACTGLGSGAWYEYRFANPADSAAYTCPAGFERVQGACGSSADAAGSLYRATGEPRSAAAPGSGGLGATLGARPEPPTATPTGETYHWTIRRTATGAEEVVEGTLVSRGGHDYILTAGGELIAVPSGTTLTPTPDRDPSLFYGEVNAGFSVDWNCPTAPSVGSSGPATRTPVTMTLSSNRGVMSLNSSAWTTLRGSLSGSGADYHSCMRDFETRLEHELLERCVFVEQQRRRTAAAAASLCREQLVYSVLDPIRLADAEVGTALLSSKRPPFLPGSPYEAGTEQERAEALRYLAEQMREPNCRIPRGPDGSVEPYRSMAMSAQFLRGVGSETNLLSTIRATAGRTYTVPGIVPLVGGRSFTTPDTPRLSDDCIRRLMTSYLDALAEMAPSSAVCPHGSTDPTCASTRSAFEDALTQLSGAVFAAMGDRATGSVWTTINDSLACDIRESRSLEDSFRALALNVRDAGRCTPFGTSDMSPEPRPNPQPANASYQRVVDGEDMGSGVPSSYRLTRLPRNRYEVGLKLDFTGLGADFEAKVRGCYGDANSGNWLAGPASGEPAVTPVMELALLPPDPPTPAADAISGGALPPAPLPPRAVRVGPPPTPAVDGMRALNWNASWDCPRIMHETMEVLGLVDEYPNVQDGYIVRDGRIYSTGASTDVATRASYNCRFVGPSDSLMRNSALAYAHCPPQSLLRASHFNAIVQPGCLSANRTYYSCARSAYTSSRFRLGEGCARDETEGGPGTSLEQTCRVFQGNSAWMGAPSVVPR